MDYPMPENKSSLMGIFQVLPASHYPAEQSWKQEANYDAILSKNSASKMSIRD